MPQNQASHQDQSQRETEREPEPVAKRGELQDFEFGVRPDAKNARTDAHLGAAIVLGGDAVARGDRAVARRSNPFVGVGGVNPHLAVDFSQAARPLRPVFIGLRPRGAKPYLRADSRRDPPRPCPLAPRADKRA